jgi:hypothetical protein
MPFIMAATLIDMISIGIIIPVCGARRAVHREPVRTDVLVQRDHIYVCGREFLRCTGSRRAVDRYGRRPVLLLGFCGFTVAFSSLQSQELWLVAIRLVAEALMANVAITNAYVADIGAGTACSALRAARRCSASDSSSTGDWRDSRRHRRAVPFSSPAAAGSSIVRPRVLPGRAAGTPAT